MSDPRESPNATAKIGDLRNMAKVYDRVNERVCDRKEIASDWGLGSRPRCSIRTRRKFSAATLT